MVTSREGLHHSLLTAIIILSLILDIGVDLFLSCMPP